MKNEYIEISYRFLIYNSFSSATSSRAMSSITNPISSGEAASSSDGQITIIQTSDGSFIEYWGSSEGLSKKTNAQIVAVVDISGSMRFHIIAAIKKLVESLGKKYHGTTTIHIITFNSTSTRYEHTLDQLTDKLINSIFSPTGSTRMEGVPCILDAVLKSMNPELPILILGVSDGDIMDQTDTTNSFANIKKNHTKLQITAIVVRLFTSVSEPATHALTEFMSLGNGKMFDIPFVSVSPERVAQQIEQFGNIIDNINIGTTVKIKTNIPLMNLTNGSLIACSDLLLSSGQLYWTPELITLENIVECPCTISFTEKCNMSLLEKLDQILRKFVVLDVKSTQPNLTLLFEISNNLIKHCLAVEAEKDALVESDESGSYLDNVRRSLLKTSNCENKLKYYEQRLRECVNINKTDLVGSGPAATFMKQGSAVLKRAAKQGDATLDDIFKKILGLLTKYEDTISLFHPAPETSFISLMNLRDMFECLFEEDIFTENLDNILQIIGGLGICIQVDKTTGTADAYQLVVIDVTYGMTASESDVCNALALNAQLKTFGRQILNCVVPIRRLMGPELYEIYFKNFHNLAKLQAAISIRGSPIVINGDIPARIVCTLIHLLKHPEPTEIYNLYVEDLVGELKYFMNSESYNSIAAHMANPSLDPRSVWVSNIASIPNVLAILIGNKFCDPLTTDMESLTKLLIYLYEFDMYLQRRANYKTGGVGDYCDERIKTEGVAELLHFLGFSSMATFKDLATSLFNAETGSFVAPILALNFDPTRMSLPNPDFYIRIGKIISPLFDETKFLESLNEQLQVIYVNTLIGFNQSTRVNIADGTVLIYKQIPLEMQHEHFTQLLMKYLTPEKEIIKSDWEKEQIQIKINKDTFLLALQPIGIFLDDFPKLVKNRSVCGYKTMLELIDDLTVNIPDRILKMMFLMCGVIPEFPDHKFSNGNPCETAEISSYKILFDKICPISATGEDVVQSWTDIMVSYNAVPKGYRLSSEKNRHGHGYKFPSYAKYGDFSNIFEYVLYCVKTGQIQTLYKYMYEHRNCCDIHRVLRIKEYFDGFHEWKQLNLTKDSEKMMEPLPGRGQTPRFWSRATGFKRGDKSFEKEWTGTK